MAGRSLSPDETERLCQALRERRAAGETQEQLATRIGVSQQTVSRALRGDGAGFDLARRFAAAYGLSVDALLSGRPTAAPEAPTFDRVPGYEEAERIARLANPRIPDDVWQAVRGIRGAALQHPTPAGLAAAAQLVLESRAPLRPDQAGDRVREYPDDGDSPPAPKAKKGR